MNPTPIPPIPPTHSYLDYVPKYQGMNPPPTSDPLTDFLHGINLLITANAPVLVIILICAGLYIGLARRGSLPPDPTDTKRQEDSK